VCCATYATRCSCECTPSVCANHECVALHTRTQSTHLYTYLLTHTCTMCQCAHTYFNLAVPFQAQAIRTGIARALRLFVQSALRIKSSDGRVPVKENERSLVWLHRYGLGKAVAAQVYLSINIMIDRYSCDQKSLWLQV